jgi:hypothetical protein
MCQRVEIRRDDRPGGNPPGSTGETRIASWKIYVMLIVTSMIDIEIFASEEVT